MSWRRQETAARVANLGPVPMMPAPWAPAWVNFTESHMVAGQEAMNANGYRSSVL
jgi:hypothetical protein